MNEKRARLSTIEHRYINMISSLFLTVEHSAGPVTYSGLHRHHVFIESQPCLLLLPPTHTHLSSLLSTYTPSLRLNLRCPSKIRIQGFRFTWVPQRTSIHTGPAKQRRGTGDLICSSLSRSRQVLLRHKAIFRSHILAFSSA